MKTTIAALTALALSIAPAASLAQNANAPGQDRVCLVETSVPGNFANENVISTKYLPRKAAEAQAKGDTQRFLLADYSNEAEVLNGTYDDARDFCENYFDDL
jgi:uncharacterized SAM-dependent methyltransferase